MAKRAPQVPYYKITSEPGTALLEAFLAGEPAGHQLSGAIHTIISDNRPELLARLLSHRPMPADGPLIAPKPLCGHPADGRGVAFSWQCA